jgi:hypothetical protein
LLLPIRVMDPVGYVTSFQPTVLTMASVILVPIFANLTARRSGGNASRFTSFLKKAA